MKLAVKSPAHSGGRLIKKYPLLWAVVLLTVFSACDKEEEAIPAYLHIEPFVVQSTDPGTHGSISHKITNATLFITDKTSGQNFPLGTVALPATIPVLASGEVELNIDPVIKANGSSFYLEIYPFYKRFTKNISLVPEEEISVTPVTSYKTEAVFEFIEDFEQPGNLFEIDRDNNTATHLENATQDIFEGEFSGRVFLDEVNNVIVAQSNKVYEIDYASAGKIFMELNYKTEVPMEFGLVAIDNIGGEDINFEFVVLAKTDWNKIYFDMTNLLSTAGTNKFSFIFRAGIPYENGAYTLKDAEVFLDNIKLVHF